MQLIGSSLLCPSDDPVETVAFAISLAGHYGLQGHTSVRDDVQPSWVLVLVIGWPHSRYLASYVLPGVGYPRPCWLFGTLTWCYAVRCRSWFPAASSEGRRLTPFVQPRSRFAFALLVLQ